MAEIALIIFSLLLVLACAMFVAAEFSLITVNRSTIDHLVSKGDKRARGVSLALKTLSTQLSGAQVGITITTLSIGFLADPAISHLLEPSLANFGMSEKAATSVSIFLSIAIAAAVTMVFGELVPKKYSLAKPIETAKFTQGPQRLFSKIMKYPIKLLNGSANIIVRKMGVEPREELASARSSEEISSLVKRSAEQGTLARETAMIIGKALDFDELTALDVLTPRVKMHALNIDSNVDDVIKLTKLTGHSRFPVYGKSLDDIVGVIHVKNVIGITKLQRKTTSIKKFVHEPVFAPSSIKLDDLLEILRGGGMQMAIVIDEFGGTDGLVTIEDIVEELVGEVNDEHDKNKLSSIRRRHGGGWLVPGILRPDEITDETDIIFPEYDVETIGGQVSHLLERLPQINDSISLEAQSADGKKVNLQFTVIELDGKRIDKLHMQIITKPKGKA